MKFEHERQNFIPLAGGLGNQLFQMSAGLAMSNRNEVSLVTNMLNPRCDTGNNPDVFQFVLPEEVTRVDLQPLRTLPRKIAFFLLKLTVTRKTKVLTEVVKFIAIKVSNRIFSRALRAKINVQLSEGLGFCSELRINENSLSIGYFQSYKWAMRPDVLRLLKSIQTQHSQDELRFIEELAIEDCPLIVHFRLGDYLNEDDFGIPSKNYYKVAIEKQLSTGIYKAIWAFSDEPEKAANLIPGNLTVPVKWNVSLDDSNASSLQAMRYGKGYVIANSTFSWWGAFLSFEEDPLVITPTPWFKNLETPKDLIPENWFKLDAK